MIGIGQSIDFQSRLIIIMKVLYLYLDMRVMHSVQKMENNNSQVSHHLKPGSGNFAGRGGFFGEPKGAARSRRGGTPASSLVCRSRSEPHGFQPKTRRGSLVQTRRALLRPFVGTRSSTRL